MDLNVKYEIHLALRVEPPMTIHCDYMMKAKVLIEMLNSFC